MTRSNQNGFTLLEAMVAIVVLSSVSFAVFSWVNQSVQLLMRADAVMTQELVLADLLSEMEFIDLRFDSEGELERDGIKLHWSSKAVETREGRTPAGLLGFYDMTLYEVVVRIHRDELQVADYKYNIVSYVQVRKPSEELRL